MALPALHPMNLQPNLAEQPMAAQAALDQQLLNAVEKRQHALVVELLDRGASPNAARAPENLTAVHIAAAVGHHQIFVALKRAGGKLNARTTDGITPLHLAARKGRKLGILNMLLQARCDPNERDASGCTALHWACRGRNWRTAALLVTNKATLDVQDSRGRTPLHVGARKGRLPAVGQLLDAMVISKKGDRASLLKHINTSDAQRMTPLLAACKQPQGALPIRLLDSGAQPDARDKHSNTALHIAAAHSHEQVLSHLLQRPAVRALLNTVNSKGQTPLHVACLRGSDSTVQVLLAAGADVHLRVKGMAALHIALERQRFNCISQLMAAGADPTALYGAGAVNRDSLRIPHAEGMCPLQRAVRLAYREEMAVLMTPATLQQLAQAMEGRQQQQQQEQQQQQGQPNNKQQQPPSSVLEPLAEGVYYLLMQARALLTKPGEGPTAADEAEATWCVERVVSCCHAAMDVWGVAVLSCLLQQVAHRYHLYGARPAELLLKAVHSRWLDGLPWLQRTRLVTDRLQQLVIQPSGVGRGAQQQADELWGAAEAAADAGDWAGVVQHLEQLVGLDRSWAEVTLIDLAAGSGRGRLGVVALSEALLAAWWEAQHGPPGRVKEAVQAAVQAGLQAAVVAAVRAAVPAAGHAQGMLPCSTGRTSQRVRKSAVPRLSGAGLAAWAHLPRPLQLKMMKSAGSSKPKQSSA
jgi:ankyrin repeat protein